MPRADVNPLRCAVRAARKPGAYIELRNPCCARAQGDRPWSPVQRMRWTPVRPFDVYVSPLGPAGNASSVSRPAT